MVIDYPENGTRELLARERLHESEQLWAGTPLTFIHPENDQSTADKPESYVREVIGQVFKPEVVDDEKLRVQAYLDIEKARDIGGLAEEVVDRLQAGENLSVSAGYATIDDRYTTGTHNGDNYDVEQGMLLPDHVAVFPSDQFKARCDWEDGCGAPRANYIAEPDSVEQTENACQCEHEESDVTTNVLNVETIVHSYVTTNTLDEARDPNYEGLTSAEWNPPSFTEYVQEWADRTDSNLDDQPTMDSVPDQAKQFTANRTLVGDPDADSTGDLVAFPVVNLDDELNEHALLSAIRLAGHAGDDDTRDSIQDTAERLLETAPGDGDWPSGQSHDFSEDDTTENAHSGEHKPGSHVQWREEEGERNFGLVRERVTSPNTCREVQGTVRCATEDRNVLIIERTSETGEGLTEFHVKFEDVVEPWSGGSTAAGTAMNADESGVSDADDTSTMTDQETEDPATLFQRFMNSIGATQGPRQDGAGARANAASESADGDSTEGSSEAGSGDDETTTDDAETSDDAEDGGSEVTDDDQTQTGDDTMGDQNKSNQQSLSVEDLAEHTMFSVETLEEMGEDMLETLEQEVIQELLGSGKGGEGGSMEGEEQQANAQETDDGDTETVTNNEDDSHVTEEQLETRLDDFEENITNSIGDTVEEKLDDFAEQKENSQKREQQARIVANAIEGMTVNAAKSLPDEELESLADEHGGQEARMNMAGVPGEMNRNFQTEPDEAEYEDYPGGGRDDYEARKSGGD